MGKIKCSKCDNENLQFVNLPYQIKREPFIFKFVLGILTLVFILSLMSFLSVLAVWFSEPEEYMLQLKVFFIITSVSGLIALIVFAFLKLTPPDTYSNLHYVCSNCGNIESIKDMPENKNTESIYANVHKKQQL